jgi:hypothetical protein
MKVNKNETHDRLLAYKKKQEGIGEGVLDCIKNVPESIKSPFYVYGHTKTVDFDEKLNILTLGHEESPDSRLIWMPTITKPKATPNTYLFLAKKNSDVIEIIWMLPKFEIWQEYAPGKMMHNENIWISINSYLYHRDQLNAPDKEGPNEKDAEIWRRIYGEEAHKRFNEKKSMLET